MTEKIKIAIVGLRYVGMSLAVFLGRAKNVVALDIEPDRSTIDIDNGLQFSVHAALRSADQAATLVIRPLF